MTPLKSSRHLRRFRAIAPKRRMGCHWMTNNSWWSHIWDSKRIQKNLQPFNSWIMPLWHDRLNAAVRWVSQPWRTFTRLAGTCVLTLETPKKSFRGTVPWNHRQIFEHLVHVLQRVQGFHLLQLGPGFQAWVAWGRRCFSQKEKWICWTCQQVTPGKKNPHKCKCQGTHYVMKLSKSDDPLAHLCPPQVVKVFDETFQESSGGIWVCQALDSTLVATTRGESPLFCKTNLPKKGI